MFNHAFVVMGPFVIYDENKNIEFDPATINDPKVTQRDIDVALDFAIHNNVIMNVTFGSVGKVNELGTSNTELERTLKDLEYGKFKALFTESGAVGSTNDVTPVSYHYVQQPIVTVFGIDSVVPVQNSAMLIACGGGFKNPHPVPPVIPSRYYDSPTKIIAHR